jgi:hypothetical protein
MPRKRITKEHDKLTLAELVNAGFSPKQIHDCAAKLSPNRPKGKPGRPSEDLEQFYIGHWLAIELKAGGKVNRVSQGARQQSRTLAKHLHPKSKSLRAGETLRHIHAWVENRRKIDPVFRARTDNELKMVKRIIGAEKKFALIPTIPVVFKKAGR